MANLGLVFLTGLTTGGLSCLAVQGGLLASSIAKQTEDDLLEATKRKDQQERELYSRGPHYVIALRALEDRNVPAAEFKKRLNILKQKYPTRHRAAAALNNEVKPHTARPILLFLSSKLIAYTILGALLGLLGSMLQLTPYMRAVFQLAIGVYMLGLAMHLLGVHPIFRYFMIQPPRFLTRYIRRKAKSGADDVVTPTFLGAMTVFIPCGVTTAMMIVAMGTGNALAGAAVMFAFTLGTSPVFFTLAYTAAKLGAKRQALFLKFAAIVIIILGLVAVEGGLNLAGSPVSYARIKRNFTEKTEPVVAADVSSEDTVTPEVKPEAAPTAPTPAPTAGAPEPAPTPKPAPAASPAPPPAPSVGKLFMTATYVEYAPGVMKASAGRQYKLEIQSIQNESCGRAFTIPALGIQKVLPVEGTTIIDIPPQKKGSLEITCSMGMYFSEIRFE